jgi:hypothetical protein
MCFTTDSKQQLIDINFPHVHFYLLYRAQLVIDLVLLIAKKEMISFLVSYFVSEYLARKPRIGRLFCSAEFR